MTSSCLRVNLGRDRDQGEIESPLDSLLGSRILEQHLLLLGAGRSTFGIFTARKEPSKGWCCSHTPLQFAAPRGEKEMTASCLSVKFCLEASRLLCADLRERVRADVFGSSANPAFDPLSLFWVREWQRGRGGETEYSSTYSSETGTRCHHDLRLPVSTHTSIMFPERTAQPEQASGNVSVCGFVLVVSHVYHRMSETSEHLYCASVQLCRCLTSANGAVGTSEALWDRHALSPSDPGRNRSGYLSHKNQKIRRLIR